MPGPTITVRSEGGVVSDVDVPDEGTVQRELFDGHLAAGRYVVVSGDWPAADDEPADEKPKRSRKPKAEPEPEPPADDDEPAEGGDD